MQLVEVRLHGHLKKFQPETKFAVKSLRELFRALESQLEGFKKFFIDKCLQGQGYRIIVSGREFDENQITHPIGGTVVSIIPVLKGSGNIAKIILGVALVAGGIASGGAGFIGISATTMIVTGASLILNGIVGLFMHPKNDSEEENKQSFIMNGGANVATANSRIPLIFGCGFKNQGLIVGSITTSFNIASYETESADD